MAISLFGCSSYGTDNPSQSQSNENAIIANNTSEDYLEIIPDMGIYVLNKDKPTSPSILIYRLKPVEEGSFSELGAEGSLVFKKCVMLIADANDSTPTALVFPEGSAYLDKKGEFWFRGKNFKEGDKLNVSVLTTSKEEANTKIDECNTEKILFVI